MDFLCLLLKVSQALLIYSPAWEGWGSPYWVLTAQQKLPVCEVRSSSYVIREVRTQEVMGVAIYQGICPEQTPLLERMKAENPPRRPWKTAVS